MFIKWVIKNWIHVARIREWRAHVRAEINFEFSTGVYRSRATASQDAAGAICDVSTQITWKECKMTAVSFTSTNLWCYSPFWSPVFLRGRFHSSQSPVLL